MVSKACSLPILCFTVVSSCLRMVQAILMCCLSTGAGALQDSLFRAALACLEEGSPQTRACGRKLLLELHSNIIEPARFQGLLDKLHSQGQCMKVKEVMNFTLRQWHRVRCTSAKLSSQGQPFAPSWLSHGAALSSCHVQVLQQVRS